MSPPPAGLNTFQINAQVVMHNHVPELGYLSPLQLWMCRFQGIGYALRGLGQCMQVAQYCILNQCVSLEGSLSGCSITLNPLDALADMNQVQTVVLHRGTASSNI